MKLLEVVLSFDGSIAYNNQSSTVHLRPNIVFDANILSRILYALQRWSGFQSQELFGRIVAFFTRMYNYSYCQCKHTFANVLCFSNVFNVSLLASAFTTRKRTS
jgi:hypothetical protein